jgi:hypothetical protein
MASNLLLETILQSLFHKPYFNIQKMSLPQMFIIILFQSIKLNYAVGHQVTAVATNCGGFLLDHLPYCWLQQSQIAIQNSVRDSTW